MRRVKCMFVSQPGVLSEWGKAVIEIVSPQHELRLYDHSQSLDAQLANVEAIINDDGVVTPPMLAAPNLKLWQIISVGVDGNDFSAAQEHGIAVAHTPGFTSSVGLSDAAIMFMLMLAKRYHEGADYIRRNALWVMGNDELEGKTLGLIGFGASGLSLAKKAKAFGMEMMIIEPLDIPQKLLDTIEPSFVGKPDYIDKVMAEADYVSLHLPLSPQTAKIIDARRIALMKPTACFINVARGNLVDESALHQALLNGKIGGIGTDVFSGNNTEAATKLLAHPRFVASPHASGTTTAAYRRRAEVAAENVDRIAQGLEPKYLVPI